MFETLKLNELNAIKGAESDKMDTIKGGKWTNRTQ